jgi:hypothetical protein
MKTQFSILILSVFFVYAYGQDTTLFIHKWSNPNKVTKWEKRRYCSIEYNETPKDSSFVSYKVSLAGWMRDVTDTSIIIAVQNESIKIDYGTGLYRDIDNHYLQDPRDLKVGKHYGDELRNIKFNKINYFSKSDVRKGYAFGSALATISVLTALIIAPTVSMNFHNGTFNTKKYFSVLAGCGVGFCIGLPIALLNNDRKGYSIKSSKPEESRYYYLDNK